MLSWGLSQGPLVPSSPGQGFDTTIGPCWASCSEQGRVIWASFLFCFFFFPAAFFGVCASCLNRVALFVGNKKNQTVQVVSEGPTRLSTGCGGHWWTQTNTEHCQGLERKEYLKAGLRTLVQHATSARRENHQPVWSTQRRGRQTFCSRHVSSPCESITFHKEMLTIKCVH